MNKILLILALTVSLSAKSHELFFIENKGQVTDQFHNSRQDIDLMLRSNGMSMFIGNGVIYYQFRKPTRDDSYEHGKHKMSSTIEMYRMDVELIGANIAAPMISSGKQDYYEQYYMPQFGPEGVLANAYQKITYKDIYPHIDWVFYIKDGSVEQDFIVNEGGDPSQIRIRYNGATGLQINNDGSFTANTPMGSINEKAPVCVDAQNRTIKSLYRLNANILSFNIDKYSGKITIDPTLVWEQYNGGTGFDDVSGLDCDGQGNVYTTGENEGSNVATTGAFQGTFGGIEDGYITKFTSTGNIVWGTFFGGPSEDQPFEAVYSNGAIYIYGLTQSTTGIASPGAHQTTASVSPVSPDAFLAKFSSSGSRVWSTYYGGASAEDWGDIANDADGNIYMVGLTISTSGIATPGSHQPTLASPDKGNGFLVKFNSDGIRQWGTYYGGSGGSSGEWAFGVACDALNNIYIVGSAGSPVNIATMGSYQENIQGTSNNGFVAKFNNNGERIWGTYYCGNTGVKSVTCDPQNNVFITGMTTNENDIATSGAYQTSYAGGSTTMTADDCFVTKMTSSGQRIWSTYIGGSDRDYVEQIYSDDLGHVYIIGSTKSSTDFPTHNAYQSSWGGGSWDGFFAKFSNNGLCMWSSYLGGQYSDGGHDLTIENNNTFYVGSLEAVSSNIEESAYLAKFSDNSAGVKRLEQHVGHLEVYPNPAIERLIVKGVRDGDHLNIVDILGQTVYKKALTHEDVNSGIDIKDLRPGIYFVSSRGATVKFIKQ